MSNRKKIVGLSILAICLGTLLFLFLYRYDNKYTSRGSQPINGILLLSEEEIKEVPVHYLINDWEFYPNELLTPEAFSQSTEELYMRYVSIGQYGGMEMGRRSQSSHGSGTYRLMLSLPEQSQIYTLMLPNIYSAYQLYIDDELYVQMGNPSPEHFESKMQERIVSFRKGGNVQIVIAVSDFTNYYSGIVYPPMFGLQPNIQAIRGVKLLLREILLVIAFIVTAICFYLFIRSHRMINLYFALLSICYGGYTAYPLISTFLAVGSQPWHIIQLLCYYLMIPMVLLIYQWVADEANSLIRKGAIFLAILGVFLSVFSVFVELTDKYWIMEIYSWAGDCIKWGAAVCMFFVAAILVKKENINSKRLYVGALFYGVALVVDRLLPLYEPIFGGWFMEIGGLGLVLMLHSALWKNMTDAYKFQLTFEEHSRQMHHMLELQQLRYQNLLERIKETRRLRHDMRQHMHILESMAQKDDLAGMKAYLDDYKANLDGLETPIVFFENRTADSVAYYYYGIARKKDIPMTITGSMPELKHLANVDISVLLGNLLENAIDAQQRVDQASRMIKMHIELVQEKLTIQVVNSFEGKLIEKHNRFYSTKHSGLGIGTDSVRIIAEQYGGFADFSYTENEFTAMIFLSLLMNEEN